MKKLFFASLMLWGFSGIAQNEVQSGFAEYKFNPDHVECMTPIQRAQIMHQLKQSQAALQQKGLLKISSHAAAPKFIWPVKKADSAPYENVWSISNYVDHDPNYPNQIKDWNCGTRTYDTDGGYNHAGIDIFTWPFGWYQFQNNQAEVIAAADGVIVYKSDGNFDMSCSMSGGNWNAVYVQHADGSIAWYGHMKKNSLTAKPVGAAVAAGEFLGVVGSSGNSTGPHLHFEVYNSNFDLVETYQGPCNNFPSGNQSWWQQQKPYEDPKINAVLTHSAVPVFNTCPATETTNLKNDFGNGNSVVAAIYLADQQPSTTVQVQLVRPNNTVAYTTTASANVFYAASYWYWTFTSAYFNMTGTWKFRATYQGKTVTHEFTYGLLSSENIETSKVEIYPNPVKETLTIQGIHVHKIKRVSLYDSSGKMVSQKNRTADKMNVSGLAKGNYVMVIQTDEQTLTKKFIKE